MLSYSARSDAAPERAWELVARPGRWSRWAPHVRGAWGLGAPEVRPGARGAVRLLGAVPVPATVTAKRAGRSWTWRVGLVDIAHRVEPRAGGCVVAVDLCAPPALEPLLRVSYGPVVALLVRNLARVAAQQPAVTR
jgi:Polyketide cyclase / dehydrase and lipid transport